MRGVLLFPLGIAIGVAFMLVLNTGNGTSDDPGGRTGPPSPERGASGSNTGTPDLTEPDEPDPADDPLVAWEVPEPLAGRYWLALATAEAVKGCREPFIENAGLALDADVKTGSIQELVTLFPTELRAELLETLLLRFPDLEWSRETLSDLYRDAGDAVKAFEILVEQLRRNVEGDAKSAAIKRMVALDPRRAAVVLENYANEEDLDVDPLMEIARLLADSEEGHLARSFLVRILDENPSQGDALDMLVELEAPEAEGFALRATEADPENPEAWTRLAAILMKLDKADSAFEAYRTAVKLTGDDEDDKRELLQQLLRIDARAALPIIKEATVDADDETLGVLGRAYLINNLRSEAFDVFLRAHDMDETDSEWLHNMVAVDPTRAAETFREMLEKDPASSNDEMMGTYGHALLDVGNAEEAFGQFLRAHEHDPQDYEWLRGLAMADPVKAAPILEERYRDNESEGDVVGALADAYAGQGRTAEAVRLYEKAIEIGDTPARWMAAMAVVEEGRGLAMLRGALDESPDDDELWGHLGRAYRKLGRLSEAREALNKALELDPSDWEWNLELQKLR